MNINQANRRQNSLAPQSEDLAGSTRSRRGLPTTFPGWGPKLLGLALTVASVDALGTQASALTDPATPKTCNVRDRPASVVRNAIPDMPTLAAIEGAQGDVAVRVNVSADGSLHSADITQSSRNVYLDREALRVARESTFASEIADCQAVSGTYLYVVSFQPNQ
jgi:TonB family protein